jgi:xylulokinase
VSLLGIDIGTTGCKAIVFDEGGGILASAYREYPLLTPQSGWLELDTARVWRDVEDAIREAAAKAGTRDPLRALSISCQGEGVTPIAADGSLLDRCIVAFDARTVRQAEVMREKIGEDRFYQITGEPIHPMGTLMKVAWWRENRPAVYERAWKFLCWEDFALWKLGAEPTMDFSLAARTMAYDVRQRAWSRPLLDAAQVDAALFAGVAPSGTAVGTLSAVAAERLGLPRGIFLVTGGHDQPCGALGAAIVRSGRANYAIGTVECITLALGEFQPGLGAQGFPCYPHVAPGLWVTLAFNLTGGALLRWFRDQFGRPEVESAMAVGKDAYDLLLADLPDEPTDLFVLPHFVGTGTPWLDTEATGAIVGLTLATTRAHVIKAILEGVTYEMALNLRLLREGGAEIAELRAIGGGAKSATWLQLKADVMGQPIMVLDVSEAPARGAAILAGVGAGVFSSAAETAEAQVRTGRTFQPNPARTAQYAPRLDRYTRLYPALRAWR